MKRIEIEVGPGESTMCSNCGGEGVLLGESEDRKPAVALVELGWHIYEFFCRGCDEPLPDDDPGVEAYVMHDDGGERLFLYCSKCARERCL